MSAPSKVRDIQSLRIRPDDWLAATAEPNRHTSMAVGCYEAKEIGCWGWAYLYYYQSYYSNRKCAMSSTRRIIRFNVEFVTPLLIGGADGRDANGLSDKALRGCWRFWCRAIIDRAVGDINRDDLNRLENEVFAFAGSLIGTKFRFNVEEHDGNRQGRFYLGFQRHDRRNHAWNE